MFHLCKNQPPGLSKSGTLVEDGLIQSCGLYGCLAFYKESFHSSIKTVLMRFHCLGVSHKKIESLNQ